MTIITGKIVDVVGKTIYKGKVYVKNNRIVRIEPSEDVEDQFIVPGLVDAHIHIESSMMVPSEFARYSVTRGTVACVCDPHEVANVCGVEGIDYMIENGRKSPMKFFFGAPSCVPSTHFETSGAVLDAEAVEKLLQREDIHFLAEMMNYPGVIKNNRDVHKKLVAARNEGKPVDGHAPGIVGKDLAAYAAGGITTDHECMTIAEAEAKMACGMKIQIREGSAAKNFDDLLPLLSKHPGKIMFCSDDKHPDDLLTNGHIDDLVRRALKKGYDPVDVLSVCSLVPVIHYGLQVGTLQPEDHADFLIVDNLVDFNVKATYIDGVKVAENGIPLFPRHQPKRRINNFSCHKIEPGQIKITPDGEFLRVIHVDDGQLTTQTGFIPPKVESGNVVSDVENDVLKMVVYNRYNNSEPAVGFIKNIGLKKGAFASTVSHDSHNIVAVGTSDREIVSAINQIIDHQGGILACHDGETMMLPLPVAGLMSDLEGDVIARKYEEVDNYVKQLGATLKAPFMTLAFMSLVVIPELKLSDKGLFDGKEFDFTNLWSEYE